MYSEKSFGDNGASSPYMGCSVPRMSSWGFPGGSRSKEPACQHRRHEFDPWVGKIPWRREWQPIPVFLPGESHGQRSLAGCSSPCGHKEWTLKRLCTHTHRMSFAPQLMTPHQLPRQDAPHTRGQLSWDHGLQEGDTSSSLLMFPAI